MEPILLAGEDQEKQGQHPQFFHCRRESGEGHTKALHEHRGRTAQPSNPTSLLAPWGRRAITTDGSYPRSKPLTFCWKALAVKTRFMKASSGARKTNLRLKNDALAHDKLEALC